MRFFKTSHFLILLILFLVFANCERISSQTPSSTNPEVKSEPKSGSEKPKTPTFDDLWNAYPKAGERIVITDYSDHFAMKWLRRDTRIADVVAHVKIIKRKLIDQTDGADCENDRGGGYCAYLLTAEVKQVYKGNLTEATLDFVGSSDADYPKKGFMGEKVVFLSWGDPDLGQKGRLETMENSTRWIDHGLLGKMKVVVDPKAAIDESDKNEPYSRVAIKKSFDESIAVAYIEAVSFRPDSDSISETGSIVTAVVKEVFKGNVAVGATLEYREDFSHRGSRKENLGPQIVYLEAYKPIGGDVIEVDRVSGKPVRKKREVQEKGVTYVNQMYNEGFIKHNILEKLREIAGKPATEK